MWIDPVRENEMLSLHETVQNRYDLYKEINKINPARSERIVQMSERYNILSPEVLISAEATGVPVDSPSMEMLADEYAANWAVSESEKWNEINEKYKNDKSTDDMHLNIIDILTGGWAPGGRTPEEVGKWAPTVWILGTFDAIRESWNKWNPLPTSDILQFGGGGVPYRAQGRIWRYYQDLNRYDELLEKGYSPEVAQSNVASLVNISRVPNLGRDLGPDELRQNIDFLKEAIEFSGENYIWAAAKKVMRGEAVNMDRSKRFFFESIDKKTDPKYADLLAKFDGDEERADQLYYLKVGAPIKKMDEKGQIHYLSIENPNKIQIFSDRRTNYNDMNVSEYAARERMDDNQLTEYSWGRYEAGQFLQQGTTSYKIASGLLDFASALPAEYITGGMLNLTKAKRKSRYVNVVAQEKAKRIKYGEVRFIDSKRKLKHLKKDMDQATRLKGKEREKFMDSRDFSPKEKLYLQSTTEQRNNILNSIYRADSTVKRKHGMFNGRMQGLFGSTSDKLIATQEARILAKYIRKTDFADIVRDPVLMDMQSDVRFWWALKSPGDPKKAFSEEKILTAFKDMMDEGIKSTKYITHGDEKIWNIPGLPKGFSNVTNKAVRGITGKQDFAMRSMGSVTGEAVSKSWQISRNTMRLMRNWDTQVKAAEAPWKKARGAIDGPKDSFEIFKAIYNTNLKPKDIGVSKYLGFSSNFKGGLTPWGQKLFGTLPGGYIFMNNAGIATDQLMAHFIQNKFTNAEINKWTADWLEVVDGSYRNKTEYLIKLMNKNYEKIKYLEDTGEISKGRASVVAAHLRKVVNEWEKNTKRYFKQAGFNPKTGEPLDNLIPAPGMKSASVRMSVKIGEDYREILIPSANLLSEMSDNVFPLIDQSIVDRAASKLFHIADPHNQLKDFTPSKIVWDEWKSYWKGGRQLEDKPSGFIPTNQQMEDAVTRTLDFYTKKIFKPIVLLRPAFFTRVFMEEQLRMSSTGLDGAYNHPFRYLAWVNSYSPEAQKRLFDTYGTFDNIMRSTEHQRVVQKHWTVNLLKGGKYSPQYNLDFPMVTLDDGSELYAKGILFTLFRLRNDPVAQYVAKHGPEEASEWFVNGKGMRYREELYEMGEDAWTDVVINDDVAINYIKSLENRIRQATGHELKPGIDYLKYNPDLAKDTRYATRDMDRAMNSHINIEAHGGNEEIRNIIATGEIHHKDEVFHMLNKDDFDVYEQLSRPDQRKLEKVFRDKVDDNPGYWNIGAIHFKEEKLLDKSYASSLESHLDTAVGMVFETLMEKNINYLNRSPVFKQYRWSYIADNFHRMDNKLRDHFVKEAKLSELPKQVIKDLEKMAKGVQGKVFNMDSYQLISDTSKAFGLSMTESLLYDVSKRHKISDMTRNIFPFPEVWFEMLTTWPKILAENPMLGRKAQLAIKGGRGTSALGYTGDGFFAEDPNGSGEQMFAYPFGGYMSNLIFGEDSKIKMSPRGYVTGVNLLGQGFVPGPTPFAGWAIDSVLPQGGIADEFRSVLFGDFGPPSGKGFWDKIIPKSPSLVKFFAAQNFIPRGNETEVSQMRANTSIELFKLLKMENGDQRLLQSGDLDKYLKKINWKGTTADKLPDDELTPDIIDSALRDYATAKARQTFLFRAMAQFVAPAGFTPRYYAEDKNGQIWGTQILAKEYQNLLKESGEDHVAAYEKFVRLYGFEHGWLTTAKSQAKGGKAAYSDRVIKWQKENKDVLEQLDLSAFYLLPDNPLEERSYQEVIRQYNIGEREILSLEEYNKAVNDTIGYFRYSAQKEKYAYSGLPENLSDNVLRNYRFALEQELPGYNRTGGTRQPPKSREILAEMIEKWPNLKIAETTETGRIFVNEFIPKWEQNKLISSQESQSGNPDWWLSSTNEIAFYMRADFQAWANEIISKYPDFAPIWTNIISRMFRNDKEYYSVLDG